MVDDVGGEDLDFFFLCKLSGVGHNSHIKRQDRRELFPCVLGIFSGTRFKHVFLKNRADVN